MAIGDLVQGDWECEFNGFWFGGESDYLIARIEGLADMPDLVNGDRARLRRHGLLPGDDFLLGRAITFTLELTGSDTPTWEDNQQEIRRAFRAGEDEQPLVFQIPGVAGGGKRRVNARPRRLVSTIDLDWFYEIPMVVVQFEATSPLIEDNLLSSVTADIATAGGGLTWPLTWPLVWGTPATSGSVIASNAGSFDAQPVFTIPGPVSNPRIESVTAGRSIELDITVADGDSLTVDTEDRTVLLNGTASRYSALTANSEWFSLTPGDNELIYRAATPTTSTLTVEWRSAWT